MSPFTPLRGRVAVVVGGGRSIGAETARVLAGAGARVAVAARTRGEIESVAAQIRNAGGQALPVPTDLGDANQVQSLASRTIDVFGRIDVVINCAAALEGLGALAWDIEEEAWRRTIGVNLTGPFLLARSMVPHMLLQRDGKLLFVSSPLASVRLPRASAYCAARAGANQFFRILAREVEGTGITVNTIYPGVVKTKGLELFSSRLRPAGGAAPQPLPRGRDASEAARLLAWLSMPRTLLTNGTTISLEDPIIRRGAQRTSAMQMGHLEGSWDRRRSWGSVGG